MVTTQRQIIEKMLGRRLSEREAKRVFKTSHNDMLKWARKKAISEGRIPGYKTNPRSRKILIDKKFIRKVKEGRDVEEVAKRLRALGHHVITNIHPPSLSTMEKWMDDGIARATDGCIVEPDGICPHKHESWLLVLGYI